MLFWRGYILETRLLAYLRSRSLRSLSPEKKRKSKRIMGKRKSRAKPAAKKRMDKLDTTFCCPFCNHGSGVECKIDLKNNIGEANCRICQENFSTTVNALTEPIDIYSEWIDECEKVNHLEEEEE